MPHALKLRLLTSVVLSTCVSCAQTEPERSAAVSPPGYTRPTYAQVARAKLKRPVTGVVLASAEEDAGAGERNELTATDGRQIVENAPAEAAAPVSSATESNVGYDGPLPPGPVGDGAPPEPDGGVMTLEQLEEIALQNNPTLALQQAEVEKERGNWTQVGMYPNPTVGYLNSSSSRNGNSQENGVLLQQTFVTGGKLEKARATETYGIQSTQWQLESQRMRVINDVRLRYIDVLGAQQQIKVVEELLTLSQKALDTARELFRGRQVARSDVLQAEVQRETVAMALENSREAYDGAWKRLAVIVGRPELSPAPVVEPRDDLPEFDLEQQWQRMLSESPLLRTSEAKVGIARSQLAVAEAAPIPNVTLQFVGSYDSLQRASKFNTLVALPVPIINRNQGGIYNAASEVHRAEREVERTQLVMRDLIVSSNRDYVLARNRVLRLRDEILPRLKENLELTIKLYQKGEVGFLQVLNAQRDSFQTNLDYIAALNQARQRAVEIEGMHLTGGLNPATIGTAIQEVGAGGRLRAVQQMLQQQGGANLRTFAPAAQQ